MFHFFHVVLLNIIIKLVCLLVTIAFYTLAERKIMAAVQRRHGPDVVGFWGLLQPLADGLKLFAKELVIPSHANSRIFVLAPLTVLTFALLAWVVIPFNLFDHSEGLTTHAAAKSLLVQSAAALYPVMGTFIACYQMRGQRNPLVPLMAVALMFSKVDI